MTNLEKSIEGLYETFAVYAYDPEMGGCPCCVTEEEKHDINKPLKMLQREDIDRYAFKAMTTWGTTENFKHYLPRIFELLTHGELLTDTFVILGKLSHGKWRTWPENEQQTIEDFLFAWWSGPWKHAYQGLEAMIEIYKLTGDIEKLTALWNLEITTENFKGMIDLIYEDLEDLNLQKYPFGDFSETGADQLMDWLLNQKERMEKGYFYYEEKDPEFAKRISDALYILENNRFIS